MLTPRQCATRATCRITTTPAIRTMRAHPSLPTAQIATRFNHGHRQVLTTTPCIRCLAPMPLSPTIVTVVIAMASAIHQTLVSAVTRLIIITQRIPIIAARNSQPTVRDAIMKQPGRLQHLITMRIFSRYTVANIVANGINARIATPRVIIPNSVA